MTLYDGDKLHIGDDIEIVIDRCIDDGNTTRLRIDAPREVPILREEVVKE